MKTMKKAERVVRVPESQVLIYLKDGWQFCAKAVWKALQKEKEHGT